MKMRVVIVFALLSSVALAAHPAHAQSQDQVIDSQRWLTSWVEALNHQTTVNTDARMFLWIDGATPLPGDPKTVWVSGWAFHCDKPTQLPTALVDGVPLHVYASRVHRPDVVAAYAGVCVAPIDNGFVFALNLSEWPVGPHSISVLVEDGYQPMAGRLHRALNPILVIMP